ncbi:protein ORAOV1 homolog isoform X4 [Asparagus officinalis]|uniref:protein ORAOV1 homolog isoform X4 n=1 Tax=Asparagus officinalis TaxID=4686 RepID=UPI00098E62CC|nr:protein ORAOV1 homolog isoform X4 [Asparagus officinalis]
MDEDEQQDLREDEIDGRGRATRSERRRDRWRHRDSGEEEGRDVGLKVGFEIGEELGFYRGCVDIWKSVVRVDSGAFSSRIQKTIEQLSELLNKYPLLEPENEGIQEMMNAIRLKFRLISANLGVKLEYEGYPKSSKQEFEDI